MPTFEKEVSVEVKIELDAFDVVDAFADEIEDLLDAIDIKAMIDFLREKEALPVQSVPDILTDPDTDKCLRIAAQRLAALATVLKDDELQSVSLTLETLRQTLPSLT